MWVGALYLLHMHLEEAWPVAAMLLQLKLLITVSHISAATIAHCLPCCIGSIKAQKQGELYLPPI